MTVEVLSSRRIEELRQETQADHLCRRLSEVVAVGWSNSSKKLQHDLRQFYAIRHELTVDNGLLLRGQRFVIPHSLKHYYTRLAMGPYSSRRFWVSGGGGGGGTHLVLIDSYSGWFEIDQLPNMTSATLITRLKCHFSTHGAPQQIMTDNAAYFTSREFQEFARICDCCHVTSSPRYPQSNGLAESAVCSAKHLLEKCAHDGTDVYVALLNLHNIPRDGLPSPAQCLLSRCTKTLIPMTKAM